MSLSARELYGEIWADDSGLQAELRRSLDPRSPDVLYELFAELGVREGDTVLDLGCRDAVHAVELAQRFGCSVLAVDPVPVHLEWARARAAEAGVKERVRAIEGAAEALPLENASVTHIWARDMFNHVDLPGALAECGRVLRLGGRMLVYQTFATDLCEPSELRRLFDALAMLPESMRAQTFVEGARRAGLAILRTEPIDSEWRERSLEHGEPEIGENLLAVARLRRREDELVARFGRKQYEAAWGGSVWGVYQLLGKLRPTVYVLGRD